MYVGFCMSYFVDYSRNKTKIFHDSYLCPSVAELPVLSVVHLGMRLQEVHHLGHLLWSEVVVLDVLVPHPVALIFWLGLGSGSLCCCGGRCLLFHCIIHLIFFCFGNVCSLLCTDFFFFHSGWLASLSSLLAAFGGWVRLGRHACRCR